MMMKLKLDSMPVAAQMARKGERGAALITMLMLATLLLSAGGALVMTTMMSATTAMDSTAEMQAYYGAEVGLQQALNALRGNVYEGADTPKIDLRKVIEPSASNSTNDPATDSNVARMSKWLDYHQEHKYPSQVRVRNAESNEFAITYDVTARDVDGDTKVVTYSTSGVFEVNDSGCTLVGGGSGIKCETGANSFTITYVPQASTSVTAYPAASSGMGSFSVSKVLTGSSIPADKPITFRLTVNQTGPWTSRDTFIASVSGDIGLLASNLQFDFKGKTVKASGTNYTLCCDPLSIQHPTISATTGLTATVTAPQPKRILLQVTGYGPKGAVKRLEMVIRRGILDLDAPAPLTLQGASDGTAPTFDTGSSGSKEYSGMDKTGSEGQLPSIAITGTDISTINSGIPKPDTIVSPILGVLDNSTVPAGTTVKSVSALTPDFLQSANAARDLLNDLQETAESLDRYNKPAADSTYTVTAANTGATKMTFVDGNCEVEGGSGLLIVTGKLTMSGNPNFNGVILVLGGGQVERDGGGSGAIYGAMIIARFDRYGTGGFLAPTFKTNGGGDSKFQYDSVSVTQAMSALSAVPGGVREY
jgi:hypothetical protein